MNIAGQILDGKYQIERELGRGGMGTVYLATHLGTERPVAIKIISPQYMQRTEFVERFRREARAAGRLRHPNVVNVTDFGFAETSEGQVAYLVMEYLDGCTLGEILDEEKNLPVEWSLDILEQVCSAVHAAHVQGIIHRDLKPDNIWLEPNQRGGYTVKVLDFGIAKLEEQPDMDHGGLPEAFLRSTHTLGGHSNATIPDIDPADTRAEPSAGTVMNEKATVANITDDDRKTVNILSVAAVPALGDEARTAIYGETGSNAEGGEPVSRSNSHSGAENRTSGRSLLNSGGSAELTRVGSVLGTPLYMSPEQCAGEHLDPRSDIYSLGVIAYQMLSGAPPFEGDFQSVMDAHKTTKPRPLTVKGVRRKLRGAIHAALEKDLEKRPASAEAFASLMRARSEGIFGLLRRALVIYSSHLPKFLMLTGFLSLPMIFLTLVLLAFSFLRVSNIVSETAGNVSIGVIGFFLSIASAFCTNLIVGSIAWIVAQHLSLPMRPVRLRPALAEARTKWKRFAGAGVLSALLPFVLAGAAGMAGFVIFAYLMLLMYPATGSWVAILIGGGVGAGLTGVSGFFATYIMLILVAPVVMMENKGVWAALKRSVALVQRSLATSFGAVAIMFFIPMVVAGTISFVVNVSARAFDPKPKPAETTSTEEKPAQDVSAPDAAPQEVSRNVGFTWGSGASVTAVDRDDMRGRIKSTVMESLIQILWLPMQILVFSFSAIIVALLYYKTRLAGGESMKELIERFEEDGRPRKKWQERVRQRLMRSGRIPSKS